MRKLSTFVDCLLITAVAVAAPTANEDFVVAEDAKTYTNAVNAANAYTDGKIAEIPAPDYSTNNTELVETIEAKAPTPDLSPFLRNDKQDSEVQIFGGRLSGFGFHADTGHNDNGWNQYTAHNGTALAQPLPSYIQSNPWNFLKQGEAIPTTGGVFNAYIHLNQKFSVGTWTRYVKPIESIGGSGIAFAFGDNVQTRASNTMVLGVGALNTNNWSFIWNGDANRIYVPTQPNISNPYSTRYNGGFHVNPSVRTGMTNPLQNFWIGDTNLAAWISILAPPETDPTVPQWAKSAQKPTYTASEVGALGTNGVQTLNGQFAVIEGGGVVRLFGSSIGTGGAGVLCWNGGNYVVRYMSDGIYVSTDGDESVAKLTLPNTGGILALLDNITVKSVKLNGTALIPDAHGAVNVQATTPADIPPAVSNIVTAAYINDRVNVTPLAGRTYDFATNIGLYTAVRDIIQALGGSITNFPAIPQN